MKKVKAGSYTDDYQTESSELVIGRMASVMVSDAENEARAVLKRAKAEAESMKAEHAAKLEETKRECDMLRQEEEREAQRITAVAKREAEAIKVEIEQLKRLRDALEEEVRGVSETVIMSLRLRQGVSNTDCYERFGYAIEDQFGNQINRLLTYGFVAYEDERLKLTEKGLFVADTVMTEFL